MFDFLKRKEKDQGVLSNLKTVTRWVKDLPAGDVFGAQEKIVHNLIQFNRENKGFSKDRLSMLMYLDEEAREMQASLCLQYLRNARMSKVIESRLWMAIHAFYWEITRGYHGFVMAFVANPGGSKIQDSIPLITTRAIRGFADIVKWNYFRYERIESKVWLRLHNLYRIAEFDNYADSRLDVYRGDGKPHSPMEEYGQVLLLSLFGGGNMQPRELEMVDRWLDDWSELIRIETQAPPDKRVFFVDTKKGYGLAQSRKNGGEASFRYISTAPLVERIRKTRAALQSGQSPVSIGLTEDFRLPEGYGLLKQVESVWSANHGAERRQKKRIPMKLKWLVIHGLATITTELERRQAIASGTHHRQPSQEELLDMKVYGFITERTREKQIERERDTELMRQSETWEQLDACETGLGFTIPGEGSAWLKVGKLVALAAEDSSNIHLAVITRIAKQADGNRLVGVRVFGESLRHAHIKPDSTGSELDYVVDEPEFSIGTLAIQAILLTGAGGEESLIMDSGKYARFRQYHLHAQPDGTRLIRLVTVLESGESWLRAGFETVSGPEALR